MAGNTDNLSSFGEENYSDNAISSPNDDILVYKYYFERQIIAAMFAIACIVGLVGNCFVIVAVVLSKKLRTTTNVFVVNLSVVDMMTCLFMPWQALAITGVDRWPLPSAPWICIMSGFVIIIGYGGSINSLALIAINRWIGITKSRHTTSRIYTTRNLIILVICAWCIPLCCALTPILTDFGELGYEKLYSTCTWKRSNPYSNSFNLLITSVHYPIQLTTIIICYTSILCYVRRTSLKMARASQTPSVSATLNNSGSAGNSSIRKQLWKRQLDVTKNLMYIVLAFIVCLSPYFVCIVFTGDWSYRLVPWSGTIIACNSCVNPIIYATSHPDFKEAFSHMMQCKKIAKHASTNRK